MNKILFSKTKGKLFSTTKVKTKFVMNEIFFSTTKGNDVTEVLDNFCRQNELEWEKLNSTKPTGLFSWCKSSFTYIVKAVSSDTAFVLDLPFMRQCYFKEELLLCSSRSIKWAYFQEKPSHPVVYAILFGFWIKTYKSLHTWMCSDSHKVMQQIIYLNCWISYLCF